ncbi:DUF58 domain-containing protein [bacterium]|nr:DUF58 domain-containing protein [bacterium]
MIERSWTYLAFRSFLRERLTSSGTVLFYMGLGSNMLSGGSAMFKGHLLGCALAAVLVVSMLAARLARRRLMLTPVIPQRVTQGVAFEVRCRVENTGKSTASDVNLRLIGLPLRAKVKPELGPFLGDVQPGQLTEGIWTVELGRRGRYVIESIHQATLFPFGLWRDWYTNKVECSLLVYPKFQPLLSLDMPVGRKYQPGGMALTSSVGDSTEFLGTREFRAGDSLRMIHWRSWARRGKPVVKEFQEEFFCRIALVMDTFLSATDVKKRREDFEAAISLAAAVADQISRDEYVIDLFAAGPELYQLQAGRSLAYLENVLDILACVEPCTEPAFEKLEPVLLDGLENVTTTVVILLDWDEARIRLLRAVRERGCALKVIFVGENYGDLSGVDDFAPGHQTLTAAQVRSGVDQL